MSGIALVYAVYGDRASAQAAAHTAIDSKLAACANILAPCTSFYRWEGEVSESEEIPVLFKTTADRRAELIALLAQNHSYDIPAILSWAADAVHPPFAHWVSAETQAD